jgi:hypothetical protein
LIEFFCVVVPAVLGETTLGISGPRNYDGHHSFSFSHEYSFYSSGRSPHWIKSKNQAAPAVKREAEEYWGSRVLSWEEPV